jgi:hypothetical protein
MLKVALNTINQTNFCFVSDYSISCTFEEDCGYHFENGWRLGENEMFSGSYLHDNTYQNSSGIFLKEFFFIYYIEFLD